MGKIDFDKFISSLIVHCKENRGPVSRWLEESLADQDLLFKNGEIKEKVLCFEEDKWYVFTHASLHYDTINGEVAFKQGKPYRCLGGETFLGDGGDYCFRGQEDMLRNLRPATKEEIEEISGNNGGISPNCELTEFEKALADTYEKYSCMHDIFNRKKLESYAREHAPELLDIARKQIEEEKVAQFKDTKAYNMGLVDGNAEAMKDMPKWRYYNSGVTYLPDSYGIVYDNDSGGNFCCSKPMLCCGNYKISINELVEKLPKEDLL